MPSWFILVPGACHGGWHFDPLAEALRRAGHTADPVTLTGLLPGTNLACGGAINLDTHIADVAALLATRDEPAVLVGHSYAGSVITGVADRHPDRVAGLLYIDAFVPRDGDSCWTMTNDEQREWYRTGCRRTGLGVDPLPFFDERAVAQPLGTLLQASRLTGAYEQIPCKHYVLATGSEWMPHSPFVPVAARLRGQPGWQVTDLNCGHNVVGYAPDELLRLVLGMV